MRDAEITKFWILVVALLLAALMVGWASALDSYRYTAMDADYAAQGGGQ